MGKRIVDRRTFHLLEIGLLQHLEVHGPGPKVIKLHLDPLNFWSFFKSGEVNINAVYLSAFLH